MEDRGITRKLGSMFFSQEFNRFLCVAEGGNNSCKGCCFCTWYDNGGSVCKKDKEAGLCRAEYRYDKINVIFKIQRPNMETKIDRKLNTLFFSKDKGGFYRVVEGLIKSCSGCVFCTSYENLGSICKKPAEAGSCMAHERADGIDVIFK